MRCSGRDAGDDTGRINGSNLWIGGGVGDPVCACVGGQIGVFQFSGFADLDGYVFGPQENLFDLLFLTAGA